MVDCLSNGRLISGFARGIPREYNVHNVKHAESRERFEEAYDIIMKAWTEDVFSYEGKFWSYHDVAIWPRPVQQPAPPVWTPITSSKESIEWAAARNIPITPGLGSRGAREDIIRYYARCLAKAGHTITPDNITISMEAYVGRQQGGSRGRIRARTTSTSTACSTATATPPNSTSTRRPVTSPTRRPRTCGPKTSRLRRARAQDYRDMTMADVERAAETLPWGTADEVRDRIIEAAEHAGAGTVQLSFNRGSDAARDVRRTGSGRFAKDVLPALQAHAITTVPLAADAAA